MPPSRTSTTPTTGSMSTPRHVDDSERSGGLATTDVRGYEDARRAGIDGTYTGGSVLMSKAKKREGKEKRKELRIGGGTYPT